jgi:hypothetical protein
MESGGTPYAKSSSVGTLKKSFLSGSCLPAQWHCQGVVKSYSKQGACAQHDVTVAGSHSSAKSIAMH